MRIVPPDCAMVGTAVRAWIVSVPEVVSTEPPPAVLWDGDELEPEAGSVDDGAGATLGPGAGAAVMGAGAGGGVDPDAPLSEGAEPPVLCGAGTAGGADVLPATGDVGRALKASAMVIRRDRLGTIVTLRAGVA
jgi:hypothetical protein